MQRIIVSDQDADHIRTWQRLSDDEKEAITKMAKLFGDEKKRKSLYTLLEAQLEISNALATLGHLGWFGRMFLKAGVIAGVMISIATFIKLYFGGK